MYLFVPLSRGRKLGLWGDQLCDQNYYYWMENVSLVSRVEESLLKNLIQFQFCHEV